MSFNEEFDELARRKLEERQFAFQEADWQDARKRIDAKRAGRGRAGWYLGAGLLLLISGAAWYGTRTAKNETVTAAVEQRKIDQTQTASTANASAIALNTSNQTSTASPIANTASKAQENEQAVNNAATGDAKASIGNNATAASQTTSIANHDATAPKASRHAENHTFEAVASIPARRHKGVPSMVAASVAVNKAGQPVSTTPKTEPPIGETLGNDGHQEGRSIVTATGESGNRQTTPPSTSGLLKDAQPPLPAGFTLVPDVTLTTPPTDEKGLAFSTAEMHLEPNPTAQPANTGTGADQPIFTATPALGDSAPAPLLFATGGSSTAAPSAPEAAAPLVPDQAPWEISVLGGVFNSKSDYSGSNSAQWSGDISTERSISVGAEFMHMGRNIGLGAGIHYGSYAEHLRSNAIDVTSSSTVDYWYLLPVDTTFLFITNTLPGQPPTYTGTSVDTTVNILTPGTHTIASTERLREARDQVNRVSYLEVPLLIDAHLVQGRWSFGVRGGPTFGLLTATRGSVPDADNEGYVAFTDLPFREFILGYTARVYFRYRFNAAWSVGIEPAIRAQLMNSLGSGDLVRRTSSKGVLLSLSYRLR